MENTLSNELENRLVVETCVRFNLVVSGFLVVCLCIVSDGLNEYSYDKNRYSF